MHRRINKQDYEPLLSSNESKKASGSRTETDCSGAVDGLQYLQVPSNNVQVPWGTVGFVTILFIAGLSCIILSISIFLNYLDPKYDDRAWPALIIGYIMFIPGAYYVKIIVCILLRTPRSSWDDVPRFN